MNEVQDFGNYLDALKADKSARSVIGWSVPLLIFGWIVVVIAGLVLIVALLGTLITIFNSRDSGAVVGVALGSLVVSIAISFVVLLQGAAVLALAHYIRMRASWTRYRVGAELQVD